MDGHVWNSLSKEEREKELKKNGMKAYLAVHKWGALPAQVKKWLRT